MHLHMQQKESDYFHDRNAYLVLYENDEDNLGQKFRVTTYLSVPQRDAAVSAKMAIERRKRRQQLDRRRGEPSAGSSLSILK